MHILEQLNQILIVFNVLRLILKVYNRDIPNTPLPLTPKPLPLQRVRVLER